MERHAICGNSLKGKSVQGKTADIRVKAPDVRHRFKSCLPHHSHGVCNICMDIYMKSQHEADKEQIGKNNIN